MSLVRNCGYVIVIMCAESYTRIDRGSSIFFVNTPESIWCDGDCLAKLVKLISLLGKTFIVLKFVSFCLPIPLMTAFDSFSPLYSEMVRPNAARWQTAVHFITFL